MQSSKQCNYKRVMLSFDRNRVVSKDRSHDHIQNVKSNNIGDEQQQVLLSTEIRQKYSTSFLFLKDDQIKRRQCPFELNTEKKKTRR